MFLICLKLVMEADTKLDVYVSGTFCEMLFSCCFGFFLRQLSQRAGLNNLHSCRSLFKIGVLFSSNYNGCISTNASHFYVVHNTFGQDLFSFCCWTTKERFSPSLFWPISVTEVLVTTLVPKRRKRSRKRRRKLVPQK